MVKIVYPNEEEILNNNFNNQIVHSVFLAGTIDNGNSKNWKEKYIVCVRWNFIRESIIEFKNYSSTTVT